ncbi:MAG: 50S ribosomal protein L9 [Myxococcales bacterium]|nr:50S ribosomal protein L9 [Myxococcales bacterium]
MMRVILQEDIPSLGVVGDLVHVKDGYARNFLIPKGKAVFASVRSVNELDHQKRLASHRREQATSEARKSKTTIEKLSIAISAKTAPPQLDDEGNPILDTLPKLFGSVTNRDLARVLAEQGIRVDRHRISVDAPIRTVGKFSAKVRLDGAITATLPVWVVPEGVDDIEAAKRDVEAKQQAARDEREAAARAELERQAAMAAAAEAEKAARQAAAQEASKAEPTSEEPTT